MTASATEGAILTGLGDGSILASGVSPINSIYTISAFTSLDHITGFRLEVLEDPSLPFAGPGRYPANGNFVLSEFTVGIMPVPEPSVVALFACGGLGFLAWRTRRNKA